VTYQRCEKFENGLIVMGDMPKIWKIQNKRSHYNEWLTQEYKNYENSLIVIDHLLEKWNIQNKWSCSNGWPIQDVEITYLVTTSNLRCAIVGFKFDLDSSKPYWTLSIIIFPHKFSTKTLCNFFGLEWYAWILTLIEI
jgi:hypothetical protein